MPSEFYIYAYLRNDGTPYYIGKGFGNRAWANHGTLNLPERKRIAILESNLTEIGALALERRYIRWWGRKDLKTGILRNRTDGGEGCSGLKVSEETKKTLSEKSKGRLVSEKTKQKISNTTKGRQKSEEWKTLMKEKMKGKNVGKRRTEEFKEDMSKRMSGANHPKFGICLSEETKLKMSLAAKNRNCYFCETCIKTISGKMNWDRHLDSKRHLSQITN